jgi:hypothetical protein
MTLSALIEAYAGYERRALLLYRRLSERFAADAVASRLWRAMSDAEAGHFTTLQLATDRLAMAGGAVTEVAVDIAAIEKRLTALEQAVAATALSAAQAAELTLEWEEAESARITALLPSIPETVRARVRTGLLGEIDAHYGDLHALLAAAGRGDLDGRVDALRSRAAP